MQETLEWNELKGSIRLFWILTITILRPCWKMCIVFLNKKRMPLTYAFAVWNM